MKITSSHRLKALLLGGLLCLSSWAVALPAPKDIEASVQAGQLDRAEDQLREVLKEKPSSAKAHYELGQVLARSGRLIEAEQELRQAQTLDPSLKFASSPQRFEQLLEKVSTRTARPAASAPSSQASGTVAKPTEAVSRPSEPPAAEPARREPGSSGLPWGWLLLGGGVIAAVLLWLRRAAGAQRVAAPAAADRVEPWGHHASNYSAAQPANPGGYAGVPAGSGGSSSMGSAVTGAVVGGIAGMAAGYALAKAFEDERPAETPTPAADGGSGFIPVSPPRDDFGSFDSGTGDGWDRGSDGRGSGDDW